MSALTVHGLRNTHLMDKPSIGFNQLRDNGRLKTSFPEIEALFGVPQDTQYHPEIDTGIHVMMVVDRAAEITDNMAVRLAALFHDLGKGQTEKNFLPSHPNHENRGVSIVYDVFTRVSIPKKYLSFCLMVTKYHGHVHRYDSISSEQKSKFLEDCSNALDTELMELFLTACKADHQGRSGYEQTEMPFQETIFKDFQGHQQHL